jgi:cardiolipin synthase C
VSESALAEAVATLVATRPRDLIERIRDVAARTAEPTPGVLAEFEALSPISDIRTEVRRLFDAWTSAGVPGIAVACAIDAAVVAGRRDGSIEVVWTGPTGGTPPVRQSSAVLIDVIRSARQRLTILSFAAYKVDEVVAELRAAAERGVEVRVVFDERASTGELAAKVGAFAAVYKWPEVYLLPNGKWNASMHVKVALADEETALVTSANLTEQALGKNMELGLLVRGGDVPRQLAKHFQWLITSNTLEQV